MTRTLYIFFLALLLIGCNSVKYTNESCYSTKYPATYDAIIVPGVPYYPDSVSAILQLRLKWSIYLYKNGYARKIIYSGADVHTPYNESRIMALIAQKNGIPKSDILCDTLAQHGTENIFYGYVLGRRNGLCSIALATDPFQSALLSFFRNKMARKFKIKGGFPYMDIDLSELGNITLDLDVNDSLAINKNHKPLSEKKSRSEIFFGSIGGNISWKNLPDF